MMIWYIMVLMDHGLDNLEEVSRYFVSEFFEVLIQSDLLKMH